MCTLRPFRVTDIFKFNRVNLDPLTETYDTRFYLSYLARFPEYFTVAEHPTSRRLMGYVMGKSEGKKDQWHGHVTAVTVAPTCRKLGLANQLMADLERISDERECRFVDLYVRKSNNQATSFYKKLGYYVHEEIPDYYTSLDNADDTENAYDMHKLLHKWHKIDELLEEDDYRDRKKKVIMYDHFNSFENPKSSKSKSATNTETSADGSSQSMSAVEKFNNSKMSNKTPEERDAYVTSKMKNIFSKEEPYLPGSGADKKQKLQEQANEGGDGTGNTSNTQQKSSVKSSPKANQKKKKKKNKR